MLCVAIALTPAFKMKFWNIGGEGQILMGGLATATVMIFGADKLSPPLLILTMLASSIVAGLVWGLIPALFKAKWNTNETLFTLMMNYIAIQLVMFFNIIWDTTGGAGYIGTINQSGREGWFSTTIASGMLGTENYIIHLVSVILLTVLVYIYLGYTKHGYEISVVGESENTARYAGISIKKVIIRTVCISGAICGLAGFLLVAGSTHSIAKNTADSRGFTAIIVAWLSKFNPFLMIFYSFLIIFLSNGSKEIATRCGLNEAAADVLTGIVLFFIIASDFFINYRLIFRHHAEKEAK
jgi:simple sugar transport system permease protein